MWLLANDSDDVAPPADEASANRLAGWMKEALARTGGAEIVDYVLFTSRTMSLYNYIHAYELPLDAYTLTEEVRREP